MQPAQVGNNEHVVNQESRIPLVRQACDRALVAATPLPPAVVKRPARRQKNEKDRPVMMQHDQAFENKTQQSATGVNA